MRIWTGNKNMECYRKMENRLLKKYHGKVAVFSDGKLIAIGRDIKDAVEKASKISKKKELFVRELFSPEEQVEAILWV